MKNKPHMDEPMPDAEAQQGLDEMDLWTFCYNVTENVDDMIQCWEHPQIYGYKGPIPAGPRNPKKLSSPRDTQT